MRGRDVWSLESENTISCSSLTKTKHKRSGLGEFVTDVGLVVPTVQLEVPLVRLASSPQHTIPAQ